MQNAIFKKFLLAAPALIGFLAGCSTAPVNVKHSPQPPLPAFAQSTPLEITDLPPPVLAEPGSEPAPDVTQAVPANTTPVFAVVMGPSGLKSYFAVGVLQEISKSRLQIRAVAGVELSALVAALYAHHGQVYEAEWQMMKLKENDLVHHSLWGTETAQSVEVLDPLIKGVFTTENLGQAKIQFFCATETTPQNSYEIIEVGPFVQTLHKCIPRPPFYEDYGGYRASEAGLGKIVRFLKDRGVTHTLYLDFETGKVPEEPVYKILHFPGGSENISDFAHRREMVQKGREAGRKLVEEIQSELGL